MEAVKESGVIPTSKFDHDLRKKAVSEVNHPAYTVKEATPIVYQPVLGEKETKALGAEHPGTEEFNFNEELESKHRDTKDMIKHWIKKIVGGGNKVRAVPGSFFSKLRNKRINEEAKVDKNEYDRDEAEIGE